MLSKKDTQRLARNFCDAVGIGTKENSEGIKKAKKRFGPKKINRLLKNRGYFSLKKSPVERAVLERLMQPEYGPLVIKSGSRYKVKRRVGECMRLVYNPNNKFLAMEMWRVATKRGAHVYLGESTSKRTKEGLLLSPLDSLAEVPKTTKAIVENVDVIFYLEPDEDEGVLSKIPSRRMGVSIPAKLRIRELWDKKKIRGCLCGWPHPETARYYKLGVKKFEKIVFGSIKETFRPGFRKLLEQYHKAFSDRKTIRITADDGTDLTFSTRGRKFLIDDGRISEEDIKNQDLYNNIPAGEIFVAPVENSAEGKFVLPKLYVRERGIAHGVVVEFKNGKLVKWSAKRNKAYLDKFFRDNDERTKIIGEFGIGANKKAMYTGGYIIVDEKILGTIHIAVGDNIAYKGKNRATGHFDMVKDLRKCKGCVYADGKLVIKNGKLVG